MKKYLISLMAGLCLAGCATSNINSRIEQICTNCQYGSKTPDSSEQQMKQDNSDWCSNKYNLNDPSMSEEDKQFYRDICKMMEKNNYKPQ